MYIATLIAPRGALDPTLVDTVRNAWGGGEATWLAPDEAAEIPLATLPGNQAQVAEEIRGMGADLVVQPAEGRCKKMLLADMDSTMTRQECIDELAEAAGVGAHVREITARAMNGELDFEGALLERVALLKGLPETAIDTVLAERISLMPGGRTLVATMKAHGAYTALVSGGFTAFTARIAAELGFDEHRANTLLARGGHLTGDVARPVLGREAKVQALQEITARLGIAESDVIAVGDGANDLGMLGRVGTGVALHAKPAVAAQCDVRIDHGDLTALLYLQGYARDAFA
ncbi:phosphoserine phosphatase SerB [Roseovarius salis]|uniref:phosphoserine phosphatase SerB n=1 Tax=Roseovarius salis TaxID=3376063 RepID=UPI0037C92E0F